MRIRVLGSAAGGGFPQWNCDCANCRRARTGDRAAQPQTQSSLAVSADDRRWFLLNASPDLRQQIAESPCLAPNGGGRNSPLVGVVVTNAEVDHVAGLLNLREGQPLALYATAHVLDVLGRSGIFDVLKDGIVARRELAVGAATALAMADGTPTGLRVTAFSVPGKTALYLEDPAAGPDFGTRPGDSIGLEVAVPDEDARFFYIPGCAAMPPDLAERLDGAKLLFFDGTLWHDDEMLRAGVGEKTGRRMGHMSVSGADGSMATLAPLALKRKVYIHINNTNPILLDDSPERAAVEAAGWTVARDGMEIVL